MDIKLWFINQMLNVYKNLSEKYAVKIETIIDECLFTKSNAIAAILTVIKSVTGILCLLGKMI